MIPVLIVERDAAASGWKTTAQVANWLIWAIFASEIVAIVIVAPRRRAALRVHWLDVAIVVVTSARPAHAPPSRWRRLGARAPG